MKLEFVEEEMRVCLQQFDYEKDLSKKKKLKYLINSIRYLIVNN